VVSVHGVAHHVVYVVGLNAKCHQLGLVIFAYAVDPEIVDVFIVAFYQASLKIEVVDKLIDLLFTYGVYGCRCLASDEGTFVGQLFGADFSVGASALSFFQVKL